MMASFEKPHPPFEPPVPWNKLYRGAAMPDPKMPTNPGKGTSGIVAPGTLFDRHLEGYNLAYVDGHVKWQKLNKPVHNSATPFSVSQQNPTFNINKP